MHLCVQCPSGDTAVVLRVYSGSAVGDGCRRFHRVPVRGNGMNVLGCVDNAGWQGILG